MGCACDRSGGVPWLGTRHVLVTFLIGTSACACNAPDGAVGLGVLFLLLVFLLQIGRREEEARDMARYAMRNPWWTLSSFDAMRQASALQGDAKQVHWQLSEAATAASTASVTGFNYKEPKTDQEVCFFKGGECWNMCTQAFMVSAQNAASSRSWLALAVHLHLAALFALLCICADRAG